MEASQGVQASHLPLGVLRPLEERVGRLVRHGRLRQSRESAATPATIRNESARFRVLKSDSAAFYPQNAALRRLDAPTTLLYTGRRDSGACALDVLLRVGSLILNLSKVGRSGRSVRSLKTEQCSSA